MSEGKFQSQLENLKMIKYIFNNVENADMRYLLSQKMFDDIRIVRLHNLDSILNILQDEDSGGLEPYINQAEKLNKIQYDYIRNGFFLSKKYF